MKTRQRLILCGLCILWIMTGCATETPQAESVSSVPVAVLFSGNQCGGPDPLFSAVWIAAPSDAPPLHLAKIGGNGGKLQWDPENEGAVWVRMGRRPTGGYGLSLLSAMARVADGAASIRIEWREPPPEMFVAQVITSPCLILKVPRSGIRVVHIEDQDGVERASVPVTE